MRLSACLGVALDIIEPCGFPLSDPALRRAQLDYGALGEVVRHRGWSDFQSAAPRGEGRLVLFTTRAAQPYCEFEFETGDTLLFGRESAGAPDEVHQAAAARLLIPLAAGARSLNVVAAAAMALGEALRQTRGFPKPHPS